MGDNGGFGRDGPAQVAKLAAAYGIEVVNTTIFSPATTDFTAELTKAKNSGPRRCWLWTATPAGSTIVKQFRQLQLPQRLVLTGANMSPQFLSGNCPDVNGAVINSYLGTVWEKLPKTNPVRAQAALAAEDDQARRVELRRRHGNGIVDVQGGDRAGRILPRRNQHRDRDEAAEELRHPGWQASVREGEPHRPEHRQHVAGPIAGCQPKPVFGAAFGVIKQHP